MQQAKPFHSRSVSISVLAYVLKLELHSHVSLAQELEGETVLLGEQLVISEAKFRETENALRR